MESMIEQLNLIIKQAKGDIAIVVKDINKNNYIYEYNSTLQFPSASLIKVFILIYILDLVKEEKVSLDLNIYVEGHDILDDTEVFENGKQYCRVRELLNWMIISSDNTATNVLMKYFGINNIQNYIEKHLNVKKTLLQRYMRAGSSIKNGFDNYTSQEDMLWIFSKLIKREILNEELCDLAIEILGNQRVNNQIMRYIDEPVCYIHKTGGLSGLNHDSGVMIINNKLYYIGVSIWNYNKNEDYRSLTGKIGKLIFTYLSNS